MSAVIVVAAGVVLLNLYALALVVLRAPVYRTRLYRPMVWNIVLSIAPSVVLVIVMTGLLLVTLLSSAVLMWAMIVGGSMAWLLILPNSAYLITELNFSHRKPGEEVPYWYDIVLVLSLALSGVLNTLLNLLLVQVFYVAVKYPNTGNPLSHSDSWVVVAIVLALVSLGMYLGRYLRFNSWDVFHPSSFWNKLTGHFRQRRARREALGFCATHTVLLAILYLVVVAPTVTFIMSS